MTRKNQPYLFRYGIEIYNAHAAAVNPPEHEEEIIIHISSCLVPLVP
jgi:hypothetical protein